MVLTDRAATRVKLRWAAWRVSLPSLVSVMARLPVLIVVALLAGVGLMLLLTPIAGRGDYGQWLMTSRYYLGQDVPAYRTISALPPVVPMVLAAIQVVVPDAVAALQLVNVLLLAGFGYSFYVLGQVLLRSRSAGALSVVIGLLVTDRFLELLAFGGLLQGAAVVFMSISVAAFARAGRGRLTARRWWLIGSASVALAALSHVGTGMIAVPVGVSVAILAAAPLRRAGWSVVFRTLAPLLVILVGVGVYWLTILLPASGDYVTNPASLAYRGPDRLLTALFSYWPTSLVVVLGVAGLVSGGLADFTHRRAGTYTVLAIWVVVTWGAVLWSAVTGAATDYPRFATILLAPLVVAAAAASLGLVRLLIASKRADLPHLPISAWPIVMVAAVVLVAAPFAVSRFARQASVYQPRDADALTSAVRSIDVAVPARRSVLTTVRDGKWLEGLTGREALFNQPVRYAFRPIEWQRSVDSDVLLRSNGALSNGFFLAELTALATEGTTALPTNLLLGVNHGGEFVDLLQVGRGDTTIRWSTGSSGVDRLVPVRMSNGVTQEQVSLSTVWRGRTVGVPSLTETLRVWRDGTTFDLVDESPGATIEKVLRPAGGTAFTTVAITEREARVCFVEVGDAEPCVRIWAAQPDAHFKSTPAGLTIRTHQSDRLELHVTALTAGQPSVGLAYLDPVEIVRNHVIGAALLYAPDPASAARSERLQALGFRITTSVGPYLVLVRQPARPAGGS